MESTTSQDPATLAMQVQSLATMVEELTRQNQEMRQWLQQEKNRIDVNGDDGVDSNELRPPYGNDKGDGRIKECHQGEDGPKFR